MTIKTWDDLRYWDSGEFQVIQENLDYEEKSGQLINPRRELMFAALDETSFSDTRVMMVGQDPYPDHNMATGIAFSLPDNVLQHKFPVTLQNIFKEYVSDLHLPYPTCGSLLSWAQQGVLLWNAIPTCRSGAPLSHNWNEWTYLTQEIVQELSSRNEDEDVVFVFMGGVAREFVKYVGPNNKVIETSHPSPRGIKFGKNPFIGSRTFTTINAYLAEQGQGKDPIDWSLP